MAQEREEDIRRRAYEIWEQEGHPEGRHADHWHRAAQEIATDRGTSAEVETGTPPLSGINTPLHPGGTLPAGGHSMAGSIGTGGGSTRGVGTGSMDNRH